ncbi:MAG: hypothetical protein WCL53_08435, partial [Chloroflexota bacterium]
MPPSVVQLPFALDSSTVTDARLPPLAVPEINTGPFTTDPLDGVDSCTFSPRPLTGNVLVLE